MANIYEKALAIQQELKAPKNLKNTFGGYNYRSCESILKAVKPLLKKHKVLLNITDDILFAGDRYFVKAVAVLIDTEGDCSSISSVGLAREQAEKKGMDAAQITGAASSYARKYALNGLFAIDDGKDSDADEYSKQEYIDKLIETAKLNKVTSSELTVISKNKFKYGPSNLTVPQIKELIEDLTDNAGKWRKWIDKQNEEVM